jgi:hypothetical protein
MPISREIRIWAEAGELDHQLQLQRATWKTVQFDPDYLTDGAAAALFAVLTRVMRALALPLRDQQLAMHSSSGLCLAV